MADNRDHSRASALLRAGVFSRESKGRTKSIDDQDAENLAAAEELGAEVVITLRDEVSASRFGTKARKGWPAVIEAITSGRIDLLILWEVSRSDRVMDTFVPFVSACRDNGVRLYVTSEENLYDPRRARDRKALLDAGSDAEYESEKISGRTLKGIVGAVREGKSHGRASWGYTREYGPIVAGKRTFTERPNEHAPLVKELFSRVAAHEPISVIVADMTARKEPTPGGGQWHRSTVKQVIRRPVYAGLRTHNGTLHPGNWPAIVELGVWQEANRVLGEPARSNSRPGRQRWLLSYAARCEAGGVVVTFAGQRTRAGVCGGPVQGTPRLRGRRDMYKCGGLGHLSIDAWALDRYVEELVFARLAREDARRVFAPDDAQSAAARRALAEVQAELDELEEKTTAGALTLEFAARVEPGIRKRLADAQGALVRHGRHGALAVLLDADDVREAWEGFTVAARRSVLERLFAAVWVAPAGERLTRWSSDADRVRVASARTSVVWRGTSVKPPVHSSTGL